MAIALLLVVSSGRFSDVRGHDGQFLAAMYGILN